jgi:hypothetical protein
VLLLLLLLVLVLVLVLVLAGALSDLAFPAGLVSEAGAVDSRPFEVSEEEPVADGADFEFDRESVR